MYRIQATYSPHEQMWFDSDYYLRNHVPLARRHVAGHVDIIRMEVTFDVKTFMDEVEVRSPCVFAIYVANAEEVDKFRAFRLGKHVEPLKEDMANYTNCKLEWTCAKVFTPDE